jgi:hypothetical protein
MTKKSTPTHLAHLHIYINDHLAGMVAELELAARVGKSNEPHPLSAYLVNYRELLLHEKQLLKKVLDWSGGKTSPTKQGAAWLMEKFGRLKPNNALLRYSKLSRVLELEVLILAATWRRALWQTMSQLEDFHSCLPAATADELAQRAAEQIQALQDYRYEATAVAFHSELEHLTQPPTSA